MTHYCTDCQWETLGDWEGSCVSFGSGRTYRVMTVRVEAKRERDRKARILRINKKLRAVE